MKHIQPLKAGWLIILITLITTLIGCAARAPETYEEEEEGAPVKITKIEPRDADGKTEIQIEGSAPLRQYTSFQLTEPLRLVVDISNANIGEFKDKIGVNSGAVVDITSTQKDNIARLEIALSQAVDTKVYQTDGKLVVEVPKPAPTEAEKPAAEAVAPTPQPEAPKEEKAEAPQPEKPTATVVSSVRASAGKEGIKVIISGDGVMKPNTFMVEGKKLVIDIQGARSIVKPSVIPVRKGGLVRVRVGQHPAPDQKVRVVLDLAKPLEYSVTPEGNTLIIAMSPVTSAKPEVKPEEKLPQEKAAPREAEQAQGEKEIAPPPSVKKEPGAAVTQELTPAAGEVALLAGGTRYTGRRISLDLQDADLVNVMRLFAEVANLNIILAPDVRGKVTVRMVNIPWDQAMSIILKMNGLGFALENNVLRIASVGALAKEDEEEMKAKETKKKAEDLITRVIPVNYSTAGTIEGTVKKSLSPRGDIVTDARTNTLIIKDIARNIDEIVSLIKLLDKPIPQVMIEARIVEANLNFSRQIGVQWGGSAKFDAAHGNPTGLTSPSSIGVTGGPTMGATPSGTGNFLVNMPAAAGAGTGGGAIGFTFGSLSKAFNLDLVLSALESSGEGKIISTPRVSALDNKEAKIEQGISIPFSTTSASGTQIQFIDAKLSLVVTPHATPDNKIFLKIQATKNAPNTALLGASGQPSIQKNEATTEILLADGETAVIGGILIVNKAVSYTKVPFFGDIPLLGWLFRTKTNTESKQELLIFVTPRVVRQEVL